MERTIKKEFKDWTGREPDGIQLLPASGSHRQYYRIRQGDKTLLGVYNDTLAENEAYFSFATQFALKGLNVPQTLHIAPDRLIYFVEDLGETTLFSLLPSPWPEDFENTRAYPIYLAVVEHLIRFQTSRPRYTKVFPIAEFTRTAMMWDLNSFKYYFLKICGLEFSESLLEKDFEKLCALLGDSPQQGFMYRDFQARNIMVRSGQPWFIDFQGGRKGPLGYDLASLLYSGKSDLPVKMRQKLLAVYIDCASNRIKNFDAEAFKREFYACVIMRILQAMGTYGLRGIHEKKSLFLKSIPYAIRNLNYLLDHKLFPFKMPEVERIVRKLKDSPWAGFNRPTSDKLQIEIFSFSVRDQNPPRTSEHGGGFVFDCRFLPNPGREPQYKTLTGRDSEVIRYLEAHSAVNEFMQNCLQMVRPAIEKYIERGFEYLSISFGCTGGQHRSVYCAERMAALIRENFDVKTGVKHLVHP